MEAQERAQVSSGGSQSVQAGNVKNGRVKKFREVATSAAGIATAVSTVVVAAATIWGVVYHARGNPAQTAAPIVSPTAARSAQSSATQLTPVGWKAQWGPGALLITNDGTVLDSIPPGNNENVVGDVYSGGSNIMPFAGTILVPWKSDQRANAQQCEYLSTTQGEAGQGVTVVPGSVVCAVMGSQTVAIITVKSINSADEATETETTVWNLPR